MNATPMESAMKQSLIQHMAKEENSTMLIENGENIFNMFQMNL